MTNKAAMILAAVSGLLGGYQKSRTDARDRDFDERKLKLQESALDQKSPSSGVANLEYLKQLYPEQNITRSEALRLLSPAGFAPPQIPGEIAAFNQDPGGVTNYLNTKANAGKPAPLDLGDDSDGGNERDTPSPSRPAIRAPGSVQPPAAPAAPAAAASPATPKKQTDVRKVWNPATGALELKDQRVHWNDI